MKAAKNSFQSVIKAAYLNNSRIDEGVLKRHATSRYLIGSVYGDMEIKRKYLIKQIFLKGSHFILLNS
jgi:hypothetical protein